MKKYQFGLLLAAIILSAFFLRAYHFSDWLYFEADQVRNANNSVDVIEKGLGELPLLGPKAGGTAFHLGPISYYLEYLSGLIFGIDSPAVFAFPNFLFLLLAIPLFYYFLNLFFPKGLSLWATTVFAFSYLVTQYARFSWNPNAIIFFGLLLILAIYKIGEEEDEKKRGCWLLVAVLSFAVSSQLHVLALLGCPLVALMFFFLFPGLKLGWQKIKEEFSKEQKFLSKIFSLSKLWRKNCPLVKINWRYWLGALAILLALYSPLIVYDINNKGANSKEFLKAFSAKNEKRSLVEKLNKTVELYGENYVLNLSSFNDKEFKGLKVAFVGCLFILISLALIIFLLVSEKRNDKLAILPRNFLVLLLLWFLVFLLTHFQLAFKIDQPRFWFPSFFVPFLFLTILLSFFWHKKRGKILASIFCGVLVSLNLSATFNWYNGMIQQDKKSSFGRKVSTSTLIQNDFIGYGQMEAVVSWMRLDAQKGTGQVCFSSPSTYLASYKYIFNRNHPDFKARRVDKIAENDLTGDCDFFVIDHSGSSQEKITEKFFGKNVLVLEGKKFGLITVWRIKNVEI